jgi:hypothetical protein
MRITCEIMKILELVILDHQLPIECWSFILRIWFNDSLLIFQCEYQKKSLERFELKSNYKWITYKIVKYLELVRFDH